MKKLYNNIQGWLLAHAACPPSIYTNILSQLIVRHQQACFQLHKLFSIEEVEQISLYARLRATVQLNKIFTFDEVQFSVYIRLRAAVLIQLMDVKNTNGLFLQ
ncbi:Hypothetical_protein [Hexamita inflata]|uniref:Hypothetical_protein n=1 Tax=Hexamita inflata TaxID=28002 RepID=A0AA86PZ31_9EUKA|nr:Hypothetical protein HINF_LOCUS31465 [Hexamita inflata]